MLKVEFIGADCCKVPRQAVKVKLLSSLNHSTERRSMKAISDYLQHLINVLEESSY